MFNKPTTATQQKLELSYSFKCDQPLISYLWNKSLILAITITAAFMIETKNFSTNTKFIYFCNFSYCEAPASVAPYIWPDDITKWPICRRKTDMESIEGQVSISSIFFLRHS